MLKKQKQKGLNSMNLKEAVKLLNEKKENHKRLQDAIERKYKKRDFVSMKLLAEVMVEEKKLIDQLEKTEVEIRLEGEKV